MQIFIQQHCQCGSRQFKPCSEAYHWHELLSLFGSNDLIRKTPIRRGRTGCKVSIPMSERWVRSNLEHVGAKNHDVIIWNFVENEVFFHHTRTSYYSCVCFVQLLQARIAQEEAWNSSRAKVKRGWCMETILLQISLQFIACHCSLCSFQLISWLS